MKDSGAAGERIRRVGMVAGLVLLALLAGYGMWAGLGAWTAQQTGWQSLPGLSPLPTGTPRPTATPGWWDSPVAAPTWEGWWGVVRPYTEDASPNLAPTPTLLSVWGSPFD